MRTAVKIHFAIAGTLIVLGLSLFVVVMCACNWDFRMLNTSKYQTNVHKVTTDFYNISIQTDTADITLAPSDDGTCKVECLEESKKRHTVEIKDGSLLIDLVDERKWYDHISISFTSPKLVLYLPQSDYAALAIKESTGDVTLSAGLHFESIDLSVSTGKIKVFSSASGEIKATASTGSIDLAGISAGALTLSTTLLSRVPSKRSFPR